MGSCSSHQAFAHAPMPLSLQATPASVTSSWQSLRLGEAPQPSHHGPGEAAGHCAPAVPVPAEALPALPLNPNQPSDHESGRLKLNPAGSDKLGRHRCECCWNPGAIEGRRCRGTKGRGDKSPTWRAESAERRSPPLPVRCGARGEPSRCSLATACTPPGSARRPPRPSAYH